MGDDTFLAAYCSIGQVTAAITIQILVDTVDTWYHKKFPRDVVVENLRELLGKPGGETGVVPVFEAWQSYPQQKFQSASRLKSNKLRSIKKNIQGLKDMINTQDAMVAECAPKTTMV